MNVDAERKLLTSWNNIDELERILFLHLQAGYRLYGGPIHMVFKDEYGNLHEVYGQAVIRYLH